MDPLVLIGFGPIEAVVVVVVVLVVFGAGRLAGVGKALGTGLREFREEARGPDAPDGDGEEGESDDTGVAAASDDERKA